MSRLKSKSLEPLTGKNICTLLSERLVKAKSDGPCPARLPRRTRPPSSFCHHVLP
jgi:hypothetical protein